ncbi:MAG: hypothetical protein HKM28_01010 [Flavobacteriaceae bacterium]|nr:hypothetical protein [Flavobacteriaceae bacterium]
MKNIFLLLLATIVFIGCQEQEVELSWQYDKTISLDSINPIGLTQTSEGIWLSDGDHKRIVLVDLDGTPLRTIDSLERPMHIAASGDEVLVPLYGQDEIWRVSKSGVSNIALKDSLDAPAGVWLEGDKMAIADFYNHRILLTQEGVTLKSFGSEGNSEGEFYYPTDVQIKNDTIWVADAYNNRIQTFDTEGNFLQMIGAEQKMNATTGIYVSDTELFATDFENNRVLIYDHSGIFKQELKMNIDKPTDVLIADDHLIISNYRTAELIIYRLKPIIKTEGATSEK